MPNRIIKDSINRSRGLSKCSIFAQALYIKLLTYADDYGRFNADPENMLGLLYTRELDVVSVWDILDGLIELVGVGKIIFYTSAGKKEIFGEFPKWSEHQRIRDSKKNNPDPTSTEINEWFLRRYIPIEAKIAIIETDGFRCKRCGKHVTANADAKQLIKFGAGLYYLENNLDDHNGERATHENTRLICPECFKGYRAKFDYEKLIEFALSGEDSPKAAASCGELPQVAEKRGLIQSNPIQYESKSNPNPITKARARDPEPQPFTEPETTTGIDRAFDAFWAAYPLHKSKVKAYEAFQALNPDSKLLEAMILAIQKQKNWRRMREGYIPMPAKWIRERRWEDDEEPEITETKPRRVLAGQDYKQREYKESEMREILGVDSIFRADDPDSMFNEG